MASGCEATNSYILEHLQRNGLWPSETLLKTGLSITVCGCGPFRAGDAEAGRRKPSHVRIQQKNFLHDSRIQVKDAVVKVLYLETYRNLSHMIYRHDCYCTIQQFINCSAILMNLASLIE